MRAIRSIVSSYSEIFFIRNFWFGLVVLGVTFLNPNSALAGILAVAVTYALARLIGYKEAFLNHGFYVYNPLLVGFSIGYHFQLNLITCLLVCLAGVLTFGITVILAHVFSYYFRLPVLSVPFIIVSSFDYLATGTFGNLYVNSLLPMYRLPEWHTGPEWLIGFLKALGSLLFLPNVWAGAAIVILILLRSRILFSLAILGYLAGSAVHGVFIGSIGKTFSDPNSFNYILIAMGIGGVFLISSVQSYLLAVIGVAVSTVLISAVNVFWSQYGIPIFTLPFALVTLGFVYMFTLLPYRLRPTIAKDTPEETLDFFLTTQDRFSKALTLYLPITDTWTIWQGFDGKWTHKGIWKYGYDFVKTKEGKTHSDDGSRLAHYYCFGKPVAAPIRGYVVQVINHIEDNPIGSVDASSQFGNTVILYDARGLYVTLAHLAQYSTTVHVGDWVEAGQIIGLCGNSGYSPQPHLHFQVQYTIDPLSATCPFEFVEYQNGASFFAHGLPKEGEDVTPITRDLYYDQATTFILDNPYRFDVYKHQKKCGELNLKTGMAIDGTVYLESPTAKLYLGKWGNIWYVYGIEGNDPWLNLIYQAWSKMPLTYQKNLSWTDIVSSHHALLSGLKKVIISALIPFMPKILALKATYRFTSPNEIEGKIGNKILSTIHNTKIKFDAENQIHSIHVDDYSLHKAER